MLRRLVRPVGTAAVAAGLAAAAMPQRKQCGEPALCANAPPQRALSKGAEGGAEGALHRLDPAMAQRARAQKPGRVGRLFKPKQTHVVRIALTGGPCAGKSSSLAHLTEVATAEGFDVYAAPETATLIFNCGFKFPDPDDPLYDQRALAFQKAIFRLQLQIERSMTSVAASTGRPSIIVFDRGLLDGKGYITQEIWRQVIDSADEGRGVSEDYVLGRYDGVLHLVTAADGAEPFYQYGHVTDDAGRSLFRRETPEEVRGRDGASRLSAPALMRPGRYSQAKSLDRTMQRCWDEHPRHVIVRNTGTFEQKLEEATEAVLAIARTTHPQEWRRAVQLQDPRLRTRLSQATGGVRGGDAGGGALAKPPLSAPNRTAAGAARE